MMKNKKLAALLGLLLAGSMTVSMAACGSTNSASDTKADSSSQSSDSSSSDSSSDSGAGFEEVPVGPSGTAEEQDQDAGPLTVGAAAAKDSRVYVMGGEYSEALPSDVWTLDLDAPQTGWRPLPALPGPKGRSLPAAFVQNGDQKKTFLYVIGGYARRTPPGGIPAPSGDTSAELYALTDGYAYDLARPAVSGRWHPMSSACPARRR